MNFRFVAYGDSAYPQGIVPELSEIAGHLDKTNIVTPESYSLHTEYSYGKRNLNSALIQSLPALRDGHKEGVPQLWKSEEWADQFADFVIALTHNHPSPIVVEIHPPFSDYCDMDQFFMRYSVFEKKIHAVYQDTDIVIENRAGTVYHGGRFILGKADEIAEFCAKIEKKQIRLGVVLDFPQLLTAEHIDTNKFNREKYKAAIDRILPYQEQIKGVHIWGKKKSDTGRWVAHCGNLDTFFDDEVDKKSFIDGIKTICSDSRARYFVPEVNSGEADLQAVINAIIQ